MTRRAGRKFLSVVQKCVADSGWIRKPVPRVRLGVITAFLFPRGASFSKKPYDRIGSLYDLQESI